MQLRKNNGDGSWLIYFISIILILAGIFVEPLAAVLGVLIVLASLLARISETRAHKKLTRQAEKELKKLQPQNEEKAV